MQACGCTGCRRRAPTGLLLLYGYYYYMHIMYKMYVCAGVWVYRVQEEGTDGVRTGLSQTIVDVPSSSDKVA